LPTQQQLFEAFYTFVTLLAMLNPIEAAAAFATISGQRTPEQLASIAWRSTLFAAGILLVFSFAGEALLTAMGVSLPAFKIAGGLLLLKIAFGMVFAEPSSSSTSANAPVSDPSIFPLAIPIISGPGALAAGVTLVSRAHEHQILADATFVVIALVAFVIVYAAMRGSAAITKVLGPTGIDAAGRLVGIIVAAIAVQMIVNGATDLMHGKL
jgi:multiple antibiotic resistance protein